VIGVRWRDHGQRGQCRGRVYDVSPEIRRRGQRRTARRLLVGIAAAGSYRVPAGGAAVLDVQREIVGIDDDFGHGARIAGNFGRVAAGELNLGVGHQGTVPRLIATPTGAAIRARSADPIRLVPTVPQSAATPAASEATIGFDSGSVPVP